MGHFGAAYAWRVPPPSEADTTPSTRFILLHLKRRVRYECGDVTIARLLSRVTTNSATCNGKSQAALYRQTCLDRLLHAFSTSSG